MSQQLLSTLIERHLLGCSRLAALGHCLTLDIGLHTALLQAKVCLFLAKYCLRLHLLFEELTLLFSERFGQGERISLEALSKVHT